jgi:menaquinone-dependent protoporphyrinogen IX oxidase
MRALILYRSYHGNTKQTADAMAEKLRSLGHEAEVRDLRAPLPDLAGVDLFVVGAPTRMARVTGRAKAALRRLRRRGIAARPIAVFDTYGPLPKTPEDAEKGRKWLEPGAAGILRQTAAGLGLHVHPEVLRCAVKEAYGPLADGELDKARAFAERFAAAAARSAGR